MCVVIKKIFLDNVSGKLYIQLRALSIMIILTIKALFLIELKQFSCIIKEYFSLYKLISLIHFPMVVKYNSFNNLVMVNFNVLINLNLFPSQKDCL